MADFNQEQADERQRQRRLRIERIRDDFTAILNDHYEEFPRGEAAEHELEGRIVDRLKEVERGIDTFIGELRRSMNT